MMARLLRLTGIRPVWVNIATFWWEWAEREMRPCHPARPEVTLRLRALRDEQ